MIAALLFILCIANAQKTNEVSTNVNNREEVLNDLRNEQKEEVDNIAKGRRGMRRRSNYLQYLHRLGNEPLKFQSMYTKPIKNQANGKRIGKVADMYDGDWKGPNQYALNHKRAIKGKGFRGYEESHVSYYSNVNNNEPSPFDNDPFFQ